MIPMSLLVHKTMPAHERLCMRAKAYLRRRKKRDSTLEGCSGTGSAVEGANACMHLECGQPGCLIRVNWVHASEVVLLYLQAGHLWCLNFSQEKLLQLCKSIVIVGLLGPKLEPGDSRAAESEAQEPRSRPK